MILPFLIFISKTKSTEKRYLSKRRNDGTFSHYGCVIPDLGKMQIGYFF